MVQSDFVLLNLFQLFLCLLWTFPFKFSSKLFTLAKRWLGMKSSIIFTRKMKMAWQNSWVIWDGAGWFIVSKLTGSSYLQKVITVALAISFLGDDCIWLFPLCLWSIVKINDTFWKNLCGLQSSFHNFCYKQTILLPLAFAFHWACCGHPHCLLRLITLTAVVYFPMSQSGFYETKSAISILWS